MTKIVLEGFSKELKTIKVVVFLVTLFRVVFFLSVAYLTVANLA